MVAVFSEQALEANGAQIVFTESLDVLIAMDLAFAEVLVSKRDNVA
jgi:hypothetical protein